MESFEDIYKTICRVCLLRGDRENMVPLTNNNSEDGLSSYGKAVKTFAQITIEKDECLPDTICFKCLFLLKQAIYFKFTCESSEKQLRDMLKFVSSDMHVFKEKIVEFIMYGQVFPKEICGISEKPFVPVNKAQKRIREKDSMEEKHKNLGYEIDSDHLDFPSAYEEHVPKGLEISDNQLLKELEILVESSASFYNIDSNFKCVKKRKKATPNDKPTVLRRKIAKKTIKFVCHVCTKVMANRNTYNGHMQRHNGFRFICEHCGKGYPVLHQLKVHKISKHGTGTYLKCQLCPYKAPRNFDLKEHVRLHTGERPYACDKCGLTFRRRAIWKKHQLHHAEKTVQCNQCPRKFYKRSDMLAHSNSNHDRIYVYSCSKCYATYAKTATVRRHMTEKHGIPREKQGKVLKVNKGNGSMNSDVCNRLLA